MTQDRRYGSFRVTVQLGEGQTQEHVVAPLTQSEIGDGWQLVLPKKRRYMSEYTDKNDKVIKRLKTNESFFKINMTELPPHLFNKMIPIFKNGELSHYMVNDASYTYLVQPSLVDREIRELQHFVVNYNSNNYYEKNVIEHYKSLLQKVKENDINGWVVFKSQHVLKH